MDGWLFWKSLSIGVVVAAPVGPMSLLCIHRTLVSQSAALLKPPVMAWINRLSGLVLIGFAAYGLATLAWTTATKFLRPTAKLLSC